jgi:nicotinamide mononucleotide transporter
MKTAAYLASALGGAFLVCASWWQLIPISMTETLGFLSGVVCVYLVVKENIWNWPIGLANNVIYVIVFWRARLFADMSLQIVYFALGVLGWYRWRFGGGGRNSLGISRIGRSSFVYASFFAAIATTVLTLYLRTIHDAAPFLDACTSVLSVTAQYLLTKKILENWLFWIVTDALSIGLYLYKDLALTAVLYLVFLAMCIAGLAQWYRTFREKSPNHALAEPVVP